MQCGTGSCLTGTFSAFWMDQTVNASPVRCAASTARRLQAAPKCAAQSPSAQESAGGPLRDSVEVRRTSIEPGGRASSKRATPWAPSSSIARLARTSHNSLGARRSDEGGGTESRPLGGTQVEQHIAAPPGHGSSPARSPPQPASEVQVSACSSTPATVASTRNPGAGISAGVTIVLRAHTCPKTTMESVINPAKADVMRRRTRSPSEGGPASGA